MYVLIDGTTLKSEYRSFSSVFSIYDDFIVRFMYSPLFEQILQD